ncbi:Peroxidase superfamily protein [Perilla frutescens var. hirtella]|uniref:Peroxidase n=1 Tax=Perilla frutescens var. hirtella TaxID=608512 RepID=A0AAD4JBQ2_PERFH|nr:Peroxidase superfamily protein [Perilla frutescens var. hirtella]
MASPLLLLLPLSVLLLLLSPAAAAAGKRRPRQPLLTTTYYSKSCPKFEQIVQDTTTNKQISSPTTAAAALRLFFHDCFVGGCDASVLVSSTRFSKAERDADINLSLPGDGFDVVVRAKTAIELTCPGVVSCADILAVATRNLVVMMGGPYYAVKLGRKDALTSRASDVEGNLPRPTMPMSQIVQIFQSKGFSVQEMVALSGAHTIGFSHCKEFSSILYNYSKTSESDPAYYPEFAKSLRNACADFQRNPTLSVFNDVITPNKFDNVYYNNVKKGLGLLSSDHGLSSDPKTRGFVELYSRDQNAFFRAFASAMEKLSVYGVKTGRRGEIRRRCDAFNY